MIELQIRGMTCPNCVKAAEEALAAVPGVVRVVSVELESGRARVEGDAQPALLAEAVREAGYEAQVIG